MFSLVTVANDSTINITNGSLFSTSSSKLVPCLLGESYPNRCEVMFNLVLICISLDSLGARAGLQATGQGRPWARPRQACPGTGMPGRSAGGPQIPAGNRREWKDQL